MPSIGPACGIAVSFNGSAGESDYPPVAAEPLRSADVVLAVMGERVRACPRYDTFRRQRVVAAGALVVRERLHRRGIALEWFTVAWNVAEAGVAIAAGVAAGSIALIGFGVDSGIEVIGASALLWRFKQAKAGASEEEHGQAEQRALYVVSATLCALAAYIAFEAIQGLVAREEPETSTVGLVLAVVSLAVMPTLAYAKQRTGRALGSRALQADAVETWVCAYLSLALLLGVGVHVALAWWWADPVAALGMLPIIAWQGWETLEEARES